jgi:hypothetical protein
VTTDSVQANPPWGLDRIDQRKLPLNQQYKYVPGKATIYVVDAGVRVTHRDFGGRASYGYNAEGAGNVDLASFS